MAENAFYADYSSILPIFHYGFSKRLGNIKQKV